MKVLVAVFFSLAITTASGNPSPLLQVLRAVTSGDPGTEIDLTRKVKCKAEQVHQCLENTCNIGQVCMPWGDSWVQFAKVNCSANDNTPFCDPESGLCSSVAPSTDCAGESADGFQCPQVDGKYPDPQDCTKFHLCASGTSTTVQCIENNVYDHSIGECKLKRWSADCVTVNCVNKDGQNFVHPRDKKIWGTCIGNTSYILGRCNDYEEYNLSDGKCNRNCRRVENQPHSDCKKYIRCSEIKAGKYQPVTYPCPTGTGYDDDKRQCTKDAPCLKTSNTGSNPNTNPNGNTGGTVGKRKRDIEEVEDLQPEDLPALLSELPTGQSELSLLNEDDSAGDVSAPLRPSLNRSQVLAALLETFNVVLSKTQNKIQNYIEWLLFWQ